MPDYDFSALGAQYNNDYLNTIYRGLLERGYGQRQAVSMLSKIMQDTGGDPYYSSGDGKRSGIMGWGDKEYRINPFMETNPKRELNRQLDYIVKNVAASDGEDELDEYGTKVYDIVSAPMANTYEDGGGVVERRRSGGADVSLEGYKQAKRDSIINAAVNKAIARTHGVTPMINGEPGESCLYTATDNYGRQYRVAGNQTFLANPQNYGFEVNGPVENTRVGDLYQMFDYKAGNRLLPSHMSVITGYGDNGEPLVTYSRGDAYEDIYGDDYQKNARVWEMPAYETYRFVGTPSDNARWENEFRALPLVEPIPKLRHPETQGNVYGDGGGALRTALRNIDSTLKAYEDPRHSRQPVHIEPTRRSDFSGFRGGHFGGAGAGSVWDWNDRIDGLMDKSNPDFHYPYMDYVRNTPTVIQEQGRSFSDAYAAARKAGLATFMFDGKEYTTEYNPNGKAVKERYEAVMVPMTLREVLNGQELPIDDSTTLTPIPPELRGERYGKERRINGVLEHNLKACGGKLK